MECIGPEDLGYDAARRISNARFDLKPRSICYVSTESGVREALRNAKGPVRIRSGGHNHEGMCSGDDALVIDVSKLDCINIRGTMLTVGPGARLRDIYDAIAEERMLLPGGGCGDVCVGGLVQGAGWGPYSRRLGLTCDQLDGFRMVKADGTIVDLSRNDGLPPDALFKAVAGAGGGNFGVVTELRFRLFRLEQRPITSFTVSWSDRTLYAKVLDDWMSHFPGDHDHWLTSFCRVTKLAGGAALEPPIIVAGSYIGTEADCNAALARLLPNTYAQRDGASTLKRVDDGRPGREIFLHPDYQPGPPAEAVRALTAAGEGGGKLSDTCAGYPFPHKVSSCYPKGKAVSSKVIADYLSEKGTEPTARRYLSLHSFGGEINKANPWSCFSKYRGKPFLLQYQAWWANKEQKDVEQRCLAWVREFRRRLAGETEGSFMNFPDIELASDRKELLTIYYGKETLDDLMKVKQAHDPNNVFDFPMGIPRS